MQEIKKINNRVYQAKLVSKKEIAKRTYEFTFELERNLEYRPGQYAWVELMQMSFPDPKGNRRAFSLASVPNGSKRITIIFRASASGYNRSLRSLSLGEKIRIIGPHGFVYCFPKNPTTPILLISGGTGIAPFLSLIGYAAQTKSKRKITLIQGNTSKENQFYTEELESYNKTSKNIRTIQLIGKIKFKDLKPFIDLKRTLIYVSGSQGFVDYIYSKLRQKGVSEHQFRFESFYPSEGVNQEISHLFEHGKLKLGPAERKQVHQEEELVFDLINSSASHTVVTDISGNILFANQAAQDITGYSLQEMLGNTPRLWGGMMSEKFYADLWFAKKQGKIQHKEVINRRKNGEVYVASAHITPVKNKKGEVIGFIASEEDITLLRKSEQHAKENEQRFLQLSDRIPEVYWVTDLVPKERIVFVSPAFETLWGMPRKTLYTNPRAWIDRIHPEDKKIISEHFDAFLKNQSLFNVEYRVIRPDKQIITIHHLGERVLDANSRVMRIVGVARDITIEKNVDKAKTEFVSLASHQLRTPLTSVSWYTEMLLSGDAGRLSREQKKYLKEVYSGNKRMIALVNALLNVSRLELGTFAIEPKQVDVIALAKSAIQEQKQLIRVKKITLSSVYPQKPLIAQADEKLLYIVLQNLLSNAIKYTPREGFITFELTRDEKKNNYLLTFSDTGYGIPKHQQARIFSKLFRADNIIDKEIEGTGLGLYIVKSILDRAGGKIWFKSKENKGSTFFVSLPMEGLRKKEGEKAISPEISPEL